MQEKNNNPMTDHNVGLTSAEIANLWGAYIGNSMAVCFLKYFVFHAEDREIKEVLEYALSLSIDYVDTVAEIMNHEKFPIPVGFTDADVNLEAPRLYSDIFFLNYLHQTTKSGFSLYTVALPNIARSDVRDFMSKCIISLTELYNKVAEVSLSKGLFMRPPFIEVPEAVEFVQNPHFLAGFFGDKRAINVLEITHIFSNIQSNMMGKALITGFAQVAQSAEIRDYFSRGKDISSTHIKNFSSVLEKENLPVPTLWDSSVMKSTTPPFSDKIMLYHINGMNALSTFNYGAGLSGSQRHDIHVLYGKLIAQVGVYGEIGARMMIDNRFMEQTPLSPNRDLLIKK
ncbi:MAG TPA: DUF3231 family protein [Bacilli bacterium]